jgi:hypothetical protein
MPAIKPEIAIQNAILANSGITAIVGNRVFAGYCPQEAAEPFVIVRRNSTLVDHKMPGASGLRTVNSDIWITGKSYEQITDIAELIEATMYSAVHRQTMSHGGRTLRAQKMFMQDQTDEQEVIDDATGKPIRRVYQRWEMVYDNSGA